MCWDEVVVCGCLQSTANICPYSLTGRFWRLHLKNLSHLSSRVLAPFSHLQSGTPLDLWSKDLYLDLDLMSHTCLLDPTDVCHHPDCTDLHGLASTISHLDPMVLLKLYPLLYMVHYRPMDSQECHCLDQWEGILDLDLPTDTHSSPDQALALSLILGGHYHHISVPLCLLTSGQFFHQAVRSAFCFTPLTFSGS